MDCSKAQYGVTSIKSFGINCVLPWYGFFKKGEVQKELDNIDAKLSGEVKMDHLIEPPMPWVFKALQLVAPADIKVVILGQDPTPQANEATGMAFSVKDPRTVPSVLNVLLEVALEGWSVNISNGDLTKWANQGVLLLNKALTVTQGTAGAHLTHWTKFTKLLIKEIMDNAPPSVWILWGTKAQGYKTMITKKGKDYVIPGGHPSPVSGMGSSNTFFGGKYFQCANEFLSKKGRVPIDWGLAVPSHARFDVTSFLQECPPIPRSPLKRPNPFTATPPPTKKRIKTY